MLFFSPLPLSTLLRSSAVSSFPLPPSLPPPPPWSSLRSSRLLWAGVYSNKKHLCLQMIPVIQTPDTAVACRSVYHSLLLYLSSSFPFLCMSHMMTPPWPLAVLSLVVWWPSRESCATIVLLCVNGRPEVGPPVTVVHICWHSLLLYLYCSIVQQPPSHFLLFSWSKSRMIDNQHLFL